MNEKRFAVFDENQCLKIVKYDSNETREDEFIAAVWVTDVLVDTLYFDSRFTARPVLSRYQVTKYRASVDTMAALVFSFSPELATEFRKCTVIGETDE